VLSEESVLKIVRQLGQACQEQGRHGGQRRAVRVVLVDPRQRPLGHLGHGRLLRRGRTPPHVGAYGLSNLPLHGDGNQVPLLRAGARSADRCRDGLLARLKLARAYRRCERFQFFSERFTQLQIRLQALLEFGVRRGPRVDRRGLDAECRDHESRE
jgi:hypothetical protein